MAKNDKLAETPKPGALAEVPRDLIEHAGKGAEALGSDDVRPPRLALAQAMSPQVKRGDVKSIEGLKEGDLFNDLSGEIYGEGPVEIVVVSCRGARGIQFAPLTEGGGIIDGNVPLNDPRMQFTTNATGERIKPIATKFYDYLVWLVDQQELMALSMKGTQLKVAVTLNSLTKLPLKIGGHIVTNPPSWARTFSLGTAMMKKDAYSWANFTIRQSGVTSEEIRGLCAGLNEAYSKKNVIIDREPGDDDPDAPGDM